MKLKKRLIRKQMYQNVLEDKVDIYDKFFNNDVEIVAMR